MKRVNANHVSLKRRVSIGTARVLAAVLLSVFMLGLSFAGTSTVTVTSASEFSDALSDAITTGDATTIIFDAGLVVNLGSSTNIPSNVSINLTGGTLSTAGTLNVAGSISGGALVINGGTLVRLSGSSITATITVNSGGTVRAPITISLQNTAGVSTGAISALSYEGESGYDTSSLVCKNIDETLYTQMTGSNYSVYKVIDKVVTESGYVFRLGTKNTSTLSLIYTISYDGLTDAKHTSANPTSYTESDASITLTNPTKDGFTFVGWMCESLGTSIPVETMVIPSGSSGDLTITAIWVEDATAGGMSGSGGSGSSSSTTDTTDEESTTADASTTTGSTTTTKRVKQASSSTKVTFTSDQTTVMPSLETIQSSSSSFPWGLVFGGLAGLGVVAYGVAKYVERKRNNN